MSWCVCCRYGCSKWATEVQLQQLHEQFGVPVSIFRCGMILAHSKCAPSLAPGPLIFYRLVAPSLSTLLQQPCFSQTVVG